MLIKDCFPELAVKIEGYSPTADLAVCRVKAVPLLSRCKVSYLA